MALDIKKAKEDDKQTIKWNFKSKTIADIGGLNTLYKKKTKLNIEPPRQTLFYDDIKTNFTKPALKSIAPEILDTFEHYMSSYMVIVKPQDQWTQAQRDFVTTHKEMLTITIPTFVGDSDDERAVYVETREILAIPREYAISLYGKKAWEDFRLPHVHTAAMPYEDKQFRKTPLYDLKKPELIPEKCKTRPLKLAAALRREPVDQLPIAIAQNQQWQRVWDENNATIPSNILSIFCGGGKTLEAIVAILWALRSDITHILEEKGLKHESDGFGEELCKPEYDYLREQQTPCRTLKAMFVVHLHTLVEQACEAIQEYVPDARIGIIEGFSGKTLPNPDNVDFLVISTDTIAQSFDKFPPGYFDTFPILVMDEAHNNCAEYFSSAFHKFTHALFKLSLTATPRDASLGLTSGAVLFHRKRPYFPQHTNMIVYGAGERILRILPSYGDKNNGDKPNGAAQLMDLYMDMTRNAWIARIAIDSFVSQGGWQATHGPSSPVASESAALAGAATLAGRRFVYNPASSSMEVDDINPTAGIPNQSTITSVPKSAALINTRLVQYSSLDEAMEVGSVTIATDKPQENPFLKYLNQSASSSSSSSAKPTTSQPQPPPPQQAQLSQNPFFKYFTQVSKSTGSTAPMSSSQPVSRPQQQQPPSSSSQNPFAKYFTQPLQQPTKTSEPERISTTTFMAQQLQPQSQQQTSTTEPTTRPQPKNPFAQYFITTPQSTTRVVEKVEAPLDPEAAKRKPIFFSSSIPHLIMHYFWQAQEWMDTCTAVPKEHLRLIRTGVRQFAIVDIQQLIEADDATNGEYAKHLWWLTDKENRFVPKPPSYRYGTVTTPEYKTRTEWDARPDTTVRKPTVREFIDETYATPTRFDDEFWINTWFKHYPPNDEWKARIRTPKAYNKADYSKPQKKKFKKTAAVTTSADLYQQPFLADMDQSDRMMYYMYHWLPVYGPLQKTVFEGGRNTKKRSAVSSSNSASDASAPAAGVYRRNILDEEQRPTHALPGVLATFGLAVGKSYALPKALGVGATIGSAHEREALDSSLIYAIYKLASTGLDRPELCCSFESTYLLDNEQSDGRCGRVLKGKQSCYLKNEIIEPWSFYIKGAWAHHKAYRSEKRQMRFYRIERIQAEG
jgi:hypothetical protein